MFKGHCLLLGTVEYCTVSSTMLIVITFEADLWTFAWGVYSSVTPDAIISISYNNPLPNPQKSIALPCYSLKGVGMTWHNCCWNVCGEIHSGFHSAVIAIKASLTAGIWDGDAAAFKWRSQIDFLTSFHFYVPTITKQYIQVADCNLRVLPQNLPKWYLMIGRVEYPNVCLNTGSDVIRTPTKTSYVLQLWRQSFSKRLPGQLCFWKT